MMHCGEALTSRYPYSNILQVDGNYQVEIAIPGVKRENIYIEVSGNHIIVRIFDQQRISEDKLPGKRKRILRRCFVRLPDDADANFATAKINNNLLTIELAKKDKRTKNIPGNLIPY